MRFFSKLSGGLFLSVATTVIFPRLSFGQTDRAALPGSGECEPPCRRGFICREGICTPQCEPPCRRGYVCVRGSCVSACNPPCAPDEQCVNGDCVASEQPSSQASTPQVEVSEGDELRTPAISSAPETQPTPDPAGDEHRHAGFYLHFGIAPGFGWTAPEGGSSSLSGFALSPHFAIGGAITENTILAFTLHMNVMPSVQWSDAEGGPGLEVLVMNLGLGIAQYSMPGNIYGLASLCFARMDIQYKDTVEQGKGYSSNRVAEAAGLGTELALGKEWWTGREFGIGPILRSSFALVKDGEGQWTFWSFNFGIGGTYN